MQSALRAWGLMVGLATGAWAQLPAVDAVLDTNRATLGDAVELRLSLRYPADYTPLPVEAELPGGLQVQALPLPEPRREGDAVELVVPLQLKSFTLGDIAIPPLAVEFATPAGDTLVRQSPALELQVVSVRGEEEGSEPRDIKPPVEIPGGLPLWLVVVLGVALLAALVLGLLWLLDRRRKPAVELPPPPVDYLAELGRVELRQGDFKAFYSQLTELLRRFLEERLGVEALESTTGELDQALRQNELDEEQVEAIGAFLSRADLVKFARFAPDLEEAQRAPEQAMDLVRAVDAFKERQRRLTTPEAAIPSQAE